MIKVTAVEMLVTKVTKLTLKVTKVAKLAINVRAVEILVTKCPRSGKTGNSKSQQLKYSHKSSKN